MNNGTKKRWRAKKNKERYTKKKRHEKCRFGPVETVKLELVCAAACSKLEKGYGQEKKKEG